MTDKFPKFSLGIIQFGRAFSLKLGLWKRKRILAAVDLDNVNVTDKVDTVTVAKADKSTEVNKHRFVNYDAHNTNCNAVKLSVKSLFRYDQDILSSALNEETSAVARSFK